MLNRVVAGVVGKDFVAQARAVDVDVDLGGGDALVPQHLLDGAQVGTTLEQMGGKTVAQGVRTDDLADARQLTQLLDDVKYHLAREHGTTTVEEQDVLAAFLGHLVGTGLLQIEVNLFDGDLRDGHQARSLI